MISPVDWAPAVGVGRSVTQCSPIDVPVWATVSPGMAEELSTSGDLVASSGSDILF